MEIKYKLYPYPVLADYSDNYKNASFDCNIDLVKDGYNVRISFVSTLTSHSLKDLIKQGKAMFVYHLECAQTGFRKVIKTNDIETIYILSNKDVCGKLQICPFVAAVEDITEYTSEEFHEDYAGLKFDIEAGCVLAVGQMVTADINKDIEDLANAPSIFAIVRNADANDKEMMVDMAGNRKIIVRLPLNDYYSYKSLCKTPEVQPILNALTIIPALTYVLGELKRMTVIERMEFADAVWYKTIRRALGTQFDCDIESADFDEQNPLILAQKLINDPISDAFNILTAKAGGDEG